MTIETLSAAIEQHGQAVAEYRKSTEAQIAELREKHAEADAKLFDLLQKNQEGWAGNGRIDGGLEVKNRKTLGSAVNTDQFQQLLAGQTRTATATLDLDIKSTITGDTGRPPSADDVMSPASRVPTIVSGPVRRLLVTDLIPVVRVASNQAAVTLESNFTNAVAGQQFEGHGKPESVLEFSLLQKPIITLATFVKASTQVMADAPLLEQYINTRLAHFLRVRLEHEILNGDNSAGQFDGLMRTANHTEFTPGTGDTALGSLRKAAEAVELNDYSPVAVILHPSDWRKIELQKTESDVEQYSLGHADGARYVSSGMGPTVWGMNVVISRTMPEGKFICGDFGASTMLFDRQQPSVEVGYVNTDFTSNLLTVRAEMRAALGVAVPAALVAGDLTL